MGRVIAGRSFTPHGIEDILRRETRIVVDTDSVRERYQGGDRDSVGHPNLTKYYQAETDSYKKLRKRQNVKILKQRK